MYYSFHAKNGALLPYRRWHHLFYSHEVVTYTVWVIMGSRKVFSTWWCLSCALHLHGIPPPFFFDHSQRLTVEQSATEVGFELSTHCIEETSSSFKVLQSSYPLSYPYLTSSHVTNMPGLIRVDPPPLGRAVVQYYDP